MSFQQGDIVWVDFPFTDGTQTKPRPALVISNEVVNDTGDYILIQITSKVKKDGLSLELTSEDYQEAPLEIKSFIRFHKIFILNESLILSKKTAITKTFKEKVIDSILSLLK
ncbi:type II toxin-antitoxin system PemK/MazF family toxin [Adhaeribacter soli]|uniref:Type II toxin-antitoxin system PemK/MazF family toxin n=1 Tax=Adhaeribacter soli TaxID=2607655 RepID=A0A5N1J5T0_9BACT|nr:type II toxin-antitoxin system PemK/MazF family toxin [Adhaeribacter soli]KAA9346064.1 type II toxin-antitoxin system PemK/MazF family toxin [Adhaeribacter soli]